MGAVSCSSTGPAGHRVPGFVIHSLVWLSMALHTSLVKAWWGAKEGTACRRRWHAGGDRMGCGAAAVIQLHAVLGTITPHSTVLKPSAWSSAWPWTRGKYGLGRPPSSLNRTQAASACRLQSRATPGRSGCGKAPLTAWAEMGQGAHGQIPQQEDPRARQRLLPPCVPSPLGVWRGGRDRAHLQEVACPLVGVPLEGCREAEPPRAPLRGRPGACARRKYWSVGQAWRSRAISSPVPVGASSGARCHMPASTAHVEKGNARPGSYTWMVHWGRALHAGCVENPSDHVRRQDKHHSRGLHDDTLRRSAMAAPGVQGHFRLARVGDSVGGLLDVHAAAHSLIQDPALRHLVAQGGACGRVSHRGQRSVIGAGLGVLLGAPAFSGAVAPFPRGAEGGHAAHRRHRFRGRAAC